MSSEQPTKTFSSLQVLWTAVAIIGVLPVLLTPGLLIAGIMGLAREGHRGQYFFLEQAFYWSAMLYPLLFALATFAALLLFDKRPGLACLVQLLPMLLPGVLFLAASVTAGF